MAFDQRTRNLLQRTITACRRVFDREFTAQLQELYGIQPDGTLTQCEMLDHLADEELEVARLLRSRLNHLEGGEPSEALTRTRSKSENVARVIREQAFTVLNRLAALRLCEERGLVLECVRQGVNSEGFQLFMTTAGSALGETHEAYLVYLQCLFDELALDLGVLFDRFSPLALLFPRKDALEEVLRELNGTGKAAENDAISAEQFAEIWKADETIGWIYQYYNDEAERKKMRELSSAPRNSRELAVRNQFFTPRYVVEFLTDNTLGRLWYEMRHGETALRDQCHYLVRRPTEIFLKAGEAAREGSAGTEVSQEELLREPVHIPHRLLKDPREIRLLDPACGSMHFGLYAFDLLTVIYDEAWEIANGQDEVAKSAETFAPFVVFVANFSDKAAYLLQVPRLIIEHNIHGIDIDPRAAQIAGLSLWLRAQRAWHETCVKPAGRPRITRSNIVCAEPMPGEKKLLREFVEGQFDIGERSAFAYLLEKIFDHMALAGEAGSLLRIEDEIRSAVAEAHTLAGTQSVPKQAGLFPEEEKPEPKQLDLQGLLDEHFWQRAEQRIYDALEVYAEQAEDGGGFQRRLFADDAARGFAFIDLCRKRYDVALMNPPFGEGTKGTKDYIVSRYPITKNDVYAAFVERWLDKLHSGGRLGAITSRSGFFLKSFQKWREEILMNRAKPAVLADLGYGVLDAAMVETAAYVLGSSDSQDELICIRLNSDQHKEESLWHAVNALASGAPSDNIFRVAESSLALVPGSPFAYWIDDKVRSLFRGLKPLEAEGRDVRSGASTMDDFRFLRLSWEVDDSLQARSRQQTLEGKRWVPLAKGGAFSRYYIDWELLVDWGMDGYCLKTHVANYRGQKGWGYHWAAAINGHDEYFRPGLTWPRRTQGGLNIRVLPAGSIFGDKGPAIFAPTNSPKQLAQLLAVTNSEAFRSLVSLQMAFGSYEVGVLERTPVPNLSEVQTEELARCGLQAWVEKRSIDTVNLTSHAFVLPALVTSPRRSISAHTTEWRARIQASERFLAEIQSSTDKLVARLYGLSDKDREALDVISSSGQVSSEADPATERDLDVESTVDDAAALASDLTSYLLGCAFGRWDIRYSTGERTALEIPDQFAPLPVCPPGMLQGDDGLPISPEVGRQLRTEGLYPLDVAWEGILADDPEHSLDLERRVHAALAVLWAGHANAAEQEICELVGVPTLREWFRRPACFFANHLTRCSKSRRQAPIYWPLSTARGGYTLWLYYHRLTPDTLYKCLQQFVVPKLADAEKELARLRTVLAANEGGIKERNRLAELEDLRRELIELRVELELLAPKWKPNLNDGVLITAAPLWKLFRLPKWQKDLKACWKELEKGDYDWAHLAYSLWPDRVREKCKTDRSLAIAHGLEEICEVKAPMKKVKKTKKTATKDDLQEYFEG